MPVINPWIFYAIYVADGIVSIASIVTIIVGIAFLILKGFSIVSLWDYGEDDEDHKKFKTAANWLGRTVLVALILAIFVPGEKTITKMVVAQNVTYERVEAATDVVQEVYEDIMSLLEEEENE